MCGYVAWTSSPQWHIWNPPIVFLPVPTLPQCLQLLLLALDAGEVLPWNFGLGSAAPRGAMSVGRLRCPHRQPPSHAASDVALGLAERLVAAEGAYKLEGDVACSTLISSPGTPVLFCSSWSMPSCASPSRHVPAPLPAHYSPRLERSAAESGRDHGCARRCPQT